MNLKLINNAKLQLGLHLFEIHRHATHIPRPKIH